MEFVTQSVNCQFHPNLKTTTKTEYCNVIIIPPPSKFYYDLQKSMFRKKKIYIYCGNLGQSHLSSIFGVFFIQRFLVIYLLYRWFFLRSCTSSYKGHTTKTYLYITDKMAGPLHRGSIVFSTWHIQWIRQLLGYSTWLTLNQKNFHDF